MDILKYVFFANLLGNYITGRLLGGKKGGNIAALGTAIPALLQQGLGSDGFSLDSLFGGGKQSDPVTKTITNMAKVPMSGPKADEISKISKVANAVSSKGAIDPVFTQGEGTLGYSKFLVDAGLLDPNSKIANLLNTKVGEALATGLGSSLASKLSGSDGGSSGSVSRPFGGEGNISINAIRPMKWLRVVTLMVNIFQGVMVELCHLRGLVKKMTFLLCSWQVNLY